MQYIGGSLYQGVSLETIISGLTGATGVEGVILSNHADFTTKNSAATTKNTTQDNTLSSLETKATGLEAGATGLEGRNATLNSDFVTLQNREDALLAGLTGPSGLEARAVGFNNNIIDINANLDGNIQNQINTKVADSIFQALKTEFEEDFETFQNQLNQKVVTATQEVIDARQDTDDAVLEKKFCSIEEFAQTFLQTYQVKKSDGTNYNFNGKIQNINKAPPIFSIIEKTPSGSDWNLVIKLTDYGYNVMSGNLVVKGPTGTVLHTLTKSMFNATTKLYTLTLLNSNSSGTLINGPYTFEYQASTSTAIYELILNSAVLESILGPTTSAEGTGGVIGDAAWGRWIGGTGNDEGKGISATSDGVYVTGVVIGIGSTDFIQPGSFISGMGTKPSGTSDDAYIIKYNTSGDAVWGRWIGGSVGADIGSGISATSDGVYVVGYTTSTLTESDSFLLDMGTKPSASANDAFVIKYSTSGEALWGRWIGGTGADYGYSISATIDANGVSVVYVIGYASSALTQPASILTAMGTKPTTSTADTFVIKYSTSGEALWGRWIGGTGSDIARGISATADGVYVTGYTSSSLIQPASILTAMGTKPTTSTADTFVIKYSTSGEALWGRWIGGTGTDNGRAISATIDTNGVSAVYMIGYTNIALTQPASILADMGSKPSASAIDAFIIKYNTSGEAVWGRWIGGTGADYGYSISATPDGIYVTGYASSALTQPATFTASDMGTKPSVSGNDAFVIKYNTSGEAVWGRWIGGTGVDVGNDISATIDANGVSAVYVTGYAMADLTQPATFTVSGIGTKPGGTSQDAFIIKYV